MKIAVVMSTYNGEKYVEEQLESILNQKLGDIELKIYVRDDGSTDRTTEILSKYAEEGKLVFINKDKIENLRVQKSFLSALKYAFDDSDADYFAFADQDDVWREDKLKRAIDLLEKESDNGKGKLYYSNKTFVDAELNFISEHKIVYYGDIMEALWTSQAFGCTMVFDRKLTEICLRYHPTTTILHDSWVYHVSKFIGSVIVFDESSYILYRQHGNNEIGMEGTKLYHDSVLYWIIHGIPVIFHKHSHGKQKYIVEVYKDYYELIPEENRKYAEYIARYRTDPAAKYHLIHNKYMKKRTPKSRAIWRYIIVFNRL